MDVYQTTECFSPLSSPQVSYYLYLVVCGCNDEECKMWKCDFLNIVSLWHRMSELNTKSLWDEGCWTFQFDSLGGMLWKKQVNK